MTDKTVTETLENGDGKPRCLGRIRDILGQIRLRNVPVAKGSVLCVDSKSRVSEGFAQLLSWQVSAAPVFDEASQQYIGMLDLKDLLRFVIDRFDAAEEIAVKRLSCRSRDKENEKTNPTLLNNKPAPAVSGPGAVVSSKGTATADFELGKAPAVAPVTPNEKVGEVLEKSLKLVFTPAIKTVGTTGSGNSSGDSAGDRHSTGAAVAGDVLETELDYVDHIDQLLQTNDAELESHLPSLVELCRPRPITFLASNATLLDAAKLLRGSTKQVCVVYNGKTANATTSQELSAKPTGVETGTAHGTTISSIPNIQVQQTLNKPTQLPQICERKIITNVITQSTIIESIHNAARALKGKPAAASVTEDNIGSACTATIEDTLTDALNCEVDIGPSDVKMVSVQATDRTIDAFRKLCAANVAGVVVRNSRGWYADTLQFSAIKLFLSRKFSVRHFETPVSEYLLRVRSYEAQHRTTPPFPCPTLNIDRSPRLGALIEALATSHAHCLYLTTQLAASALYLDTETSSDETETANSDNFKPQAAPKYLDPLIVLAVTSVSLGDIIRTIC